MEYIQYTAALIFCAAGSWLLFLNWRVFWIRHVQGKESPSWIPLLAGILLCVGFAAYPSNPYRWLCWLAFVFDWGSLPGILYSLWHGLMHRRS